MMPKRHGAATREGKAVLLLGVWRIFDPWTRADLLVKQGVKIRHSEQRPARIGYHFGRAARRFAICLAHLHTSVRDFDRFIDEGGIAGSKPWLMFDIPEDAGIWADAALHYLNLLVDDIARMVPFALAREGERVRPPFSFRELMKDIDAMRRLAPPSLRELFSQLDRSDSWWTIGFASELGMRQRLVHYGDLLSFSASTKPGDDRMTSDIKLISVGVEVRVPDFEGALAAMLADLCRWLDDLEGVLIEILVENLNAKGVEWDTSDEPPEGAYLAPTGALGTTAFYLPLIDAAGP
jgi:hypothetical protein